MNRNQRKYSRPLKREEVDVTSKGNRIVSPDIEEVLPPRNKRHSFKADRFMKNRCCHISPVQKDVEQLTEIDDHFNDLVKQQYDFDNIIPETIKREIESEFYHATNKVDNSSQYVRQEYSPSYVETFDGSQWQNIDNTYELEQFLEAEKEEAFTSNLYSKKNIHISEAPRVKVIAEKFAKFRKDNVELRKLEEKIVCLEYDVFTSDYRYSKPSQKMKAYFSVKPIDMCDKENVKMLPASVKNKFNISEEDLNKLNEKEVEIIDAKISENKSYLDDLKKVLKRNQAIYAKKQKSTLDLMSLYEMAKRETPVLDEDFSNTNLLSKAELEAIKDLVTRKCASSIHGISRRTVKSDVKKNDNINVISQSIFAELHRNV
ncbi:uncharacterized protein LOC116769779 [Danaus plexippus]|uniref:uncharacterized protein LOC116769779 n=1 Tax=Danaus plexippus TaxID=13037 RepID=UPI002AB20CC0|nr:uncharacterized protein LOC116769779 [Danaus plexippus]